MSKVVSLADYKRQKEEEEIESLKTELADLIGEFEYVPEPYFVYTTPMSSSNYIAMFGGGPTLESCITDLQFVAAALSSLGREAVSKEIETLIEKLNIKE